jgi:formylmethanofuran dehydrogenase subunit B
LSGNVLADLGATNSPSTKPDLQIWVSSFNPDAPPSVCHMPTIILGHANTPWGEHADVFIPVSTPGLDCGGTMFRVDSAVVLPLKKVRENNLPTLSEVVSQIEALL